MLIQVRIYQEDIIVLKIYASALGVSTFIKQMLLGINTKINPSTVTVGYVTTPLLPVDMSCGQNPNTGVK